MCMGNVGFVDPSVEFALHFEYETDEFEDKLDDDINNETPELSNTDEKDSSKAQDGNTESAPETKEETATDNVVTLDAFRKK